MATVLYGDLEWDDAKARENVSKHGVTFEEAATVFADPNVAIVDDGNEDNVFKAIGWSAAARMLCVVHVQRTERERIISAWPATAIEQAIYTQGE